MDAADKEGDSALANAALNGQLAAVQFLVAAGAAVDTRNKGGKSPLDLATAQGHEEVVALLRAAGGVPVVGPAADEEDGTGSGDGSGACA